MLQQSSVAHYEYGCSSSNYFVASYIQEAENFTIREIIHEHLKFHPAFSEKLFFIPSLLFCTPVVDRFR